MQARCNLRHLVDMLVGREHIFVMLTYIVVAVLLFAVLFPMSRFMAFLVSNYRSGHLRYIRTTLGGLAKPLFIGQITAMASEFLAVLTYPLALLPSFHRERPGIPIMLVHGLFHNKAGWLLFKWRLRKAGFTNLHTYQYNSFTNDFDHAVTGFEKRLDSLLGESGDAQVVLIGHSQGGLVCRCAAGNPRFADRVAALVTLGSPHRGSDLAWCGTNKMSRDLAPGGPTAQRVERAPDPDCPRFGIYTLVDDFVFPLPMLQTGREGWREVVCSPMSHVWMLYSGEISAGVVRFLRSFL